MKSKAFRLFTALTLLAAALPVRAQGQFVFGNRELSHGVDAKVFRAAHDPNGLLGTSYFAQAYVGPSLGSLAPVGTPVNFRTGAAAGYIHSVIVTTPYPAGTKVWVEMRAWTADFATYEEAKANPVAARWEFGRSIPIQLTLTEPPDDPPRMVGLKGFTLLLPEPTPIALGVLGMLLWLARRRS